MSSYRYLPGTKHAERTRVALAALHRALTRHWRQLVCDAIVAGSGDFPRWIRREAPPADNPLLAAIQAFVPNVGHGAELWWDCWSEPARHHLELGRGCEFVRWVNDGQEGEVSGVICHGSTYPDERGDAGVDLSTPAFIDCGMGSILEQVGDWAWAECEHLSWSV